MCDWICEKELYSLSRFPSFMSHNVLSLLSFDPEIVVNVVTKFDVSTILTIHTIDYVIRKVIRSLFADLLTYYNFKTLGRYKIDQ